jgi:hypothetical protein
MTTVRRRLALMTAFLTVLAGAVTAHLVLPAGEVARHTEDSASESVRLVPWLSVLVLASVALSWFRPRSTSRSRTRLLSTVPLFAWTALEAAERVLHHESFPFASAVGPHLWSGLLVQIPFAVVVYLVVRLLVAAVIRVIRALRSVPRPRLHGVIGSALPREVERLPDDPRVRGSPQRAPPVLSLS